MEKGKKEGEEEAICRRCIGGLKVADIVQRGKGSRGEQGLGYVEMYCTVTTVGGVVV